MLFVGVWLLWLMYIQASVISPRNTHPGALRVESRTHINLHRTKAGRLGALVIEPHEVDKFGIHTSNKSKLSNRTANSTAPSTESTSKRTHKFTS